MQKELNIYLSLPRDVSENVILGYLAKYGDIIEKCNIYDFSALLCQRSKNECFVWIVDCDEDTKNVILEFSKIKSLDKNIKIIALSSNTGAEFTLGAIRAGADDVISKPVLQDILITSIENIISDFDKDGSKNRLGRVISTFSNKGGIGKTAIAVNLGYEIAKYTKKRVAIIDLNLQLGDVTTFLDLNPTFDISYLMENFDKVSEDFLLSVLQKYKDTSLYILAEPPFAQQANDISKEQIYLLLDKMREYFSYIIVDTGSNFDDKTIAALDNSDMILLSAIVNLPAIRNCQRCLDLFDRFGYNNEKIKLVLNRYMENDEIKISDVEKVLNKKVWWKIPNNYITMMSAINKGIPLSEVNSDTSIADNFKELAAKLTDGIEYMKIEKCKRN